METGILDLIIVPGVAFDKNKNRMGHGAGFYDEFITTFHNKFKRKPYLLELHYRNKLLIISLQNPMIEIRFNNNIYKRLLILISMKHSYNTIFQHSININPTMIFIEKTGSIFTSTFHDFFNTTRVEIYIWSDIINFTINTSPTIL